MTGEQEHNTSDLLQRLTSTEAGVAGQKHMSIKNVGHFLQEDKGPELAESRVRVVREI